MASATLAPLAVDLPSRARRFKQPRARRANSWTGVALRCVLILTAGGLHAAGWLFPGTWPAVWAGQAALVALGVSTKPRLALLCGTLVGAIGIASSFYWGVAALKQQFAASPAVAW